MPSLANCGFISFTASWAPFFICTPRLLTAPDSGLMVAILTVVAACA